MDELRAKEKLDKVERKLDEFYKTLLQFNAQLHEDMKTLKRGLYGDDQNKVAGLIDRQDELENMAHEKLSSIHKRVASLEKGHFKTSGIIAGVLVALQILWNFLREIFK